MFDKRKEYKTQVEPKMKEFVRACYFAGLPMVLSIAVYDDGNKTMYQNECVAPENVDLKLASDNITKFIKVIRGAKIVSEDDFIETIDADEFSVPVFDNEDMF